MRCLRQGGKKLVALLLAVCFLFSMTACFSPSDVEYDTRLNFLSSTGASIFRVVYPRDNCSESVYQAACAVQSALEQTLGTDVSLVSDMGAELAPDLVMPYEILVGNTARKETKAHIETLGQDEWSVCLTGHKIVLLGETNRATVAAVDHFMRNILGVNDQGVPRHDPDLRIELEYSYRGQYEIQPIENLLNDTTFKRAPYRAAVVYPVTVPDDRAAALSMATLQGLAALNGSEQILWKDSAYAVCLPYLVEDSGLVIEETDDDGKPWTFATLLHRYSQGLDGYILCSSDLASESALVAVTLAHHLNAVVVTPENEPTAIDAGLMCVLDASDKDDAWLRESSFFSLLDTAVAVEQSALSAPALIDYAVMTGGYCYSAREKDESALSETLRFLQTGATVLFGEDYGQLDMLSSLSELALQAVSVGYVLNLSTVSGYVPSLALSRETQDDVSGADGRHTVCFLMTDGQNLRSTLDGYTVNPGWYASPHRGTVDVSWSVPSAMFDLAPQVLSHIQSTATEHDDFVMPLSLPPHSDSADWHINARQFIATSASDTMRRLGVRYLQLPGGFDDQMYEILLKQPGIDGLICLDVADGEETPTAFKRVLDKVVVSSRYHLTAGQDISLTGIALDLNTSETDVTSPQAYSLIVIDANVGLDKSYQVVEGGDTVALVKALSERLADNVDVVTVSEFMARMEQNVK